MSSDPDERAGAPENVALRPIKPHEKNFTRNKVPDNGFGDAVADVRSGAVTGYRAAYAGPNSAAVSARFRRR